jgi:hypothetical protein
VLNEQIHWPRDITVAQRVAVHDALKDNPAGMTATEITFHFKDVYGLSAVTFRKRAQELVAQGKVEILGHRDGHVVYGVPREPEQLSLPFTLEQAHDFMEKADKILYGHERIQDAIVHIRRDITRLRADLGLPK